MSGSARRAIASISQNPVPAGEGLKLKITASAGVAELPDDAPNVVSLFAAADKALYAAKARGRNRVVSAMEAGETK